MEMALKSEFIYSPLQLLVQWVLSLRLHIEILFAWVESYSPLEILYCVLM